MSERVVLYRDLNRDGSHGPEQHLDFNSGYVYDAQGNQIDKWSIADNERTKMMADLVSHMSYGVMAEQLEKASKGAGFRAMQQANHLLFSDEILNMDLGSADVHLPAALSNYASGYTNGTPMADVVAPPMLVTKPTDKYFQFQKSDAFQRAQPIAGAAAGEVGEITPRLANATFSTIERALGGFVSVQLEAAADAPLRILQATTRRVKIALDIEREFRVANLVTTSGNWDTNRVFTLDAAHKWNGGASSDPVFDIHSVQEASAGTINGLMFSERLWHTFVRHPVVKSYYAFKDTAKPIPSPEDFKALLNLPTIYIADMKYEDSSGSNPYIWGNNVVLFRNPPQMPPMSQDDVNTALTFRWNLQEVRDGVAQGGFIVRQFYQQNRGSAGGMKVVVLHHDAEAMTSTFVGGLLVGAYQ